MRKPDWQSENGQIQLHNCDCMELMRSFADKAFDLAVVDTPYGIGENGSTNHSRGKLAVAKDYKPFAGNDIDAPPVEYFTELKRVSKNQIIWGANHFIERNPKNASCWIVWDKLNGESDFADCELAWTSFPVAVRRFLYRWAGMLQGNMADKEIRIHPTQKPVALYSWLFSKYAKPGQRILDTHLGSGSIAIAAHRIAIAAHRIAIAAHRIGLPLIAAEVDADYFKASVERIEKELAKLTLPIESSELQPQEQPLFA
jgi:site-specific DNA-methyltransferase (adenine-specific)